MSRTARLWRSVGSLTLGGLLLSGVVARGADPAPLADQLLGLGRQADAQGRTAEARTFYRKALELHPRNAEAPRARTAAAGIRRVALQDQPAATEAPPPDVSTSVPEAPGPATLERTAQLEQVLTQQLTA